MDTNSTYKVFIQWPAVRTNLSEIKTEVHVERSAFFNVPSVRLLSLFLKSPQSENRIELYQKHLDVSRK